MKELTTDILVIGGGSSGLAAASEASARGLKVIVAEAANAVGGNGLFPRGVFAVGSPIQKRKLILPDKDQVFRDCMNYSHWKIDGRIIRALIEKSGETIEWLMDKGVEFVDVVHHIPNQTPEVYHVTAPEVNAGRHIIATLKKECEGRGVEIYTGARGKSLVMDDEGNVAGGIIEMKDGSEMKVSAKKVIICTGGFAGNEEMIEKYYPNYDSSKVPAGPGMRGMGDGIRMAMEAGADIDGNFTMEIAAPKVPGFNTLTLQLGKPYNVWLNSFGMRFADEGIVYNFAMAANACLRQPGKMMYVLFNEALLERTIKDGPDSIEAIHVTKEEQGKLRETIDRAAEKGVLCKSETLEGVAEFMGVALEDLEDEIWEYNTFCR
ncbi:MAG: FAD-dependent oxidoreductase, partial [Eubacterium sp.]|nr:FAD-dependent oxidoreductase [Eubacterium sp.]